MGWDTEEYTPYVNREMILENINHAESLSSCSAEQEFNHNLGDQLDTESAINDIDTLKSQSAKDYDRFYDKIRESVMQFSTQTDLDSIEKALNDKGMDPSNPILKVEFDDFQQLNLDEIEKLFSLFGNIKDFEIHEDHILIHYDHIVSCYYAKIFLNDEFIPLANSKAKIKIQLSNKERKREVVKTHQKCKSVHSSIERAKKASSEAPSKPIPQISDITHQTQSIANSKASNMKFTCRYEIQIQNDKEFQVARKLIGSKGSNMKKIIEEWKLLGDSLEQRGFGIIKIQDLVKLRLRGRGSGFKEGPNNQESNDPLHLCISSKYSEIYDKACSLTEGLINNVYDQYYKHQIRKYGKAFKLYIKKNENIFGRKDSGSSNNSNNNFTKSKIERTSSFRDESYKSKNQFNVGSMNNPESYRNYSGLEFEECYDSYGYYDGDQQTQPMDSLNFSKSNSWAENGPVRPKKMLLSAAFSRSPQKPSKSFYPASSKSKIDKN